MSLDPLPEVKATKGQTFFRIGFSGCIFFFTIFAILPFILMMFNKLIPDAGEVVYKFFHLTPPSYWLPMLIYLLVGFDFALVVYRNYSKDLFELITRKR
jgi:hypothetical protein